MVNIASILSARNVIRGTGILFLAVGIPQVAAPAILSSILFRKRDSDQERGAVHALMQAVGLGASASGMKAFLVPHTRVAMNVHALEWLGWSAYHWSNRLSGNWDKAKWRKETATIFLVLESACAVLATLGALVGEVKDETS